MGLFSSSPHKYFAMSSLFFIFKPSSSTFACDPNRWLKSKCLKCTNWGFYVSFSIIQEKGSIWPRKDFYIRCPCFLQSAVARGEEMRRPAQVVPGVENSFHRKDFWKGKHTQKVSIISNLITTVSYKEGNFIPILQEG